MITLYCFGRVNRKVIGETRDLRAQWALEETGLPYRVQGLDHTGGELEGPEYGKFSYFGQVPVIDDGGFVVAESGALLLYLAEKSQRLMPPDFAGRTQVTQWCFVALTTVEPTLTQIQVLDGKNALNDSENQRRAELAKLSQRWFGGLERRLRDHQWIASSDFTVADILLASVLREVRKTNLVASFPHLKSYYERSQERPAWQRTLSHYAERLGVSVSDVR